MVFKRMGEDEQLEGREEDDPVGGAQGRARSGAQSLPPFNLKKYETFKAMVVEDWRQIHDLDWDEVVFVDDDPKHVSYADKQGNQDRAWTRSLPRATRSCTTTSTPSATRT